MPSPSARADAEPALLAPASYTDQIASILEQEIVRGRFRRGEHLQQDEICRRFGVSRTPAREALRKLQALGLVTLVPNKGALVQRPTLHELGQTYEVRAELEGFAAALATQNRTDDLVAALTGTQVRLRAASAVVERADGATTGPSPADLELKQLNDTFHHLIHHAGSNSRLQSMIEDLERYFPKDTVREALTVPADVHRFYVVEHDQILDEIVNGRADGARECMRLHIRAAQNHLLTYLATIGYGD